MKGLEQFFKGFKKGFEEFGYSIMIVINSFFLSVVYLIGVEITSLTGKLIGKRFLETDLSEKNTYWSDLNLKRKSIEEYYRQF